MNLKHYIFFIILILGVNNLEAQDKPSFFGIRSGVSIPYGKYHATDLDGGSFTTTGFNVSAEGVWFFHPKFGIGASAGLNFHPVDVYRLGWEKVQEDPFLEDLYIRADPYMIITRLLVFYHHFQI